MKIKKYKIEKDFEVLEVKLEAVTDFLRFVEHDYRLEFRRGRFFVSNNDGLFYNDNASGFVKFDIIDIATRDSTGNIEFYSNEYFNESFEKYKEFSVRVKDLKRTHKEEKLKLKKQISYLVEKNKKLGGLPPKEINAPEMKDFTGGSMFDLFFDPSSGEK